ncbi:putative late blight resistance protein homolog R1B-16 [Salvia hispanica]|uniref:putative late blight resistance protein homolog R1B-16 n=1 Tax=Salvia hispanica TaxID=49212 RepID=UPI0020096622|nr:putative late blight resistance protein homolog R1B-16 [Salvia hispanica]
MAAAYAALVSLMQIIHELENHPSPPISIDKQQLVSLTEHVAFLEDFVERYDSPVDGNEADPLERRIAHAAYAAEDVIESCIVDAIGDHDVETEEGTTSSSGEEDESGEETSSSSGEEDGSGEGATSSSGEEDGSVEGTTSSSGEEDGSGEGATSSSGEEDGSGEGTTSSSGEEADHVHIVNLNEDLQRVIEEMNLIKKEVSEINIQRRVVHTYVASSRSSSTSENMSMVGVDEALDQIMDHLTYRPDFQVIPIVGMGGIGKTSLAKEAYSLPLIKEHFDICAWTTISQQYDTRNILCELVSQVTGLNKENLSESGEGQLGLKLFQYLFGRRFLIVMDDMWSIEAWNKIKNFFPENKNGSRILVTTRLSNLSSELTNNYILQMEFLDEKSSWELFCKTLFRDKSCPPLLEGIGKKIVGDCRGLPLSIIVVGGLLRKIEATQACWESIWENLTSEANLDNDEHCLKLLKLSYNHLPVYLKPCFLYLGAFDEDDVIVVSTLVKLWVSEGILKPKNGESLETIAHGFLNELVDRNLVLIDKSWFGSTRNLKCFQVHDFFRDLCVREGLKEGFYHVIGEDSPHQGISSHRRVVIPYTASKEEIFDALQSMPHVRSVICGDDDDDIVQACRKSRLLRMISVRNQVDGSDGNPLVFRFANLRHVTVEAHAKLSINHLWNLQTLIVYSYEKIRVPVGIWKMRQLRHVEFLETKLHLRDPPSDDDAVVVMENLHTLKGVENFKFSENVVKRIPNIKRLLVEYVGSNGSNDDDYYCLGNIGSLSKLESLTCGEPLREGGRIHHLHNLTLPLSIKKLTLTTSYDDNMLEMIGSLPLLQKLKMLSGCFGTGKWEVVEGQFPSLTSLSLIWCRGLKDWMAKDSASIFPRLEKLRLSRLSKLEEIPAEIGDIPTLQTVELNHCSKSVVEYAKNIVDEQEETQGEITLHVSVVVSKKFEELKVLESPNFEVEVVELA